MIRILTIVMLLFCHELVAQKISVSGQLFDSLSVPLPSATILILNPNDSSLINFGITNNAGVFEIKNVIPGKYLLRISYVGYQTYFRNFKTPDQGNTADLGKIILTSGSMKLDEVTISAEKAPVVVKHDTIEFYAPSFKVQPNATVEDLIKKMPGMEVKPDGKIMAQGEEVKKVTVEGKPFFGDDPTLATKNLPADAVNKVQVYNRKSDQAQFTGIDDGQKEKAINLELKKDRKKGFFGNITGGAGTDERFKSKLNLNRFSEKNQLSFLGMAGNTNEQGFSLNDYMNFMGGMGKFMGGHGGAVQFKIEGDNQNGIPIDMENNNANGIITNYAGGVNSNNQIGKKTDINASYFVNSIHHDLQKVTDREYFLPGGNYQYFQKDNQKNNNTNQRLNFVIDQKIDSFNSIKLTSVISMNRAQLNEQVSGENSVNDSLKNESRRSITTTGTTNKFLPELLYRHNFKKKGRTFSVDLKMGLNTEASNGKMNAVNSFYDDSTRIVNQDQRSQKANSFQDYEGTFSYTDKIGFGKYIEARYQYGLSRSQVDQEVFDTGNATEIFNKALSNKYQSNYIYNNYGLNFRFVKRGYNFLAGGSVQQTGLHGNLELSGQEINRFYTNFLPTAKFNYDFTSTKHLGFEYNTAVEEPTLMQLQPIVDNSDPLNIYVGNPNLRPAYDNSFRFNYNMFSPVSFFSFFGLAEFDYKTNAISNAQSYDQDLIKTTMPVNVRNNLSGWGRLDFGIPFKKFYSRINVGPMIREEKGISLINNKENTIRTGSLSGDINYNFDYKEIVQVDLGAELEKQTSKYGFDQPDQNFMNNTYSAGLNIAFLKRYALNSNLEYMVFNNQTAGFKQEIPLLNLYASWFVFKNNRGEIRFLVNNVLDKSIGVSQSVSQNYLERNVTNALGRYFMISFTYALNQPLNPSGGMHGNIIKINR